MQYNITTYIQSTDNDYIRKITKQIQDLGVIEDFKTAFHNADTHGLIDKSCMDFDKCNIVETYMKQKNGIIMRTFKITVILRYLLDCRGLNIKIDMIVKVIDDKLKSISFDSRYELNDDTKNLFKFIKIYLNLNDMNDATLQGTFNSRPYSKKNPKNIQRYLY